MLYKVIRLVRLRFILFSIMLLYHNQMVLVFASNVEKKHDIYQVLEENIENDNSIVENDALKQIAENNDKIGKITGLPLPRFVALKVSEVNLRAGPGQKYPIKYTFRCRGYPMEMIAEFENWRMVKDINGNEGWMHENSLSKARYVIIKTNIVKNNSCSYIIPKNEALLMRLPSDLSFPKYRLELGSIGKLEKCNDSWCEVTVAKSNKGWIAKYNLWGVYADELIH